MPEADVQLIGVTKRFGTVTAVDAIDLEVYRGDFSRSSARADAARRRRCDSWPASINRMPDRS